MKKRILIVLTSLSLLFCSCGEPSDYSYEEPNTTYNGEIITESTEITEDFSNIESPFDISFGESFSNVSGTISIHEIPDTEDTYHYIFNINTREKLTPMAFSLDAPANIWEKIDASYSTTFFQTADGTKKLCVWYGGRLDKSRFEFDLDMPLDEWLTNSRLTYDKEYVELNKTDSTIDFICSITNSESKGYARFMLDANREVSYQFTYTEVIDNYDPARALNVINSIQFE